MNHGHVTPNPDGSKARCGGPAICSECATEEARLIRQPDKHTPPASESIVMPPPAAPNLVQDALKAAGVDGFFGVMQKGETYEIIRIGTNAIIEAGMVKFMTTVVECAFVDSLRPKKKAQNPPPPGDML